MAGSSVPRASPATSSMLCTTLVMSSEKLTLTSLQDPTGIWTFTQIGGEAGADILPGIAEGQGQDHQDLECTTAQGQEGHDLRAHPKGQNVGRIPDHPPDKGQGHLGCLQDKSQGHLESQEQGHIQDQGALESQGNYPVQGQEPLCTKDTSQGQDQIQGHLTTLCQSGGDGIKKKKVRMVMAYHLIIGTAGKCCETNHCVWLDWYRVFAYMRNIVITSLITTDI